MKKIRQSFYEVIAGDPHKEHYISVSIVSIVIAIIVGATMMYFWNGQY